MNNIIIPIILAYLSAFCDKYLPNLNPKYVNVNDKVLKIMEPRNILSVMNSSPIPIEKLSKDTRDEKISMFIKDKLCSVDFSFRDLIISIRIIIKTVINMYLEFTCIMSVRIWPIAKPNKGMIKWNIPTEREVINIFLLDILSNP